MGQTISRLLLQLLGAGETEDSVLSAHRNDEVTCHVHKCSTSSYQKFWQSIVSLLRRLLCRGAGKPPPATGKPPLDRSSLFYPHLKEENTSWGPSDRKSAAGHPLHNNCIDIQVHPDAGKPPSGTGKPPLDRSSLFYPYLKEENTSWGPSDRNRAAGHPLHNNFTDIQVHPEAGKPPSGTGKPPLDRSSFYPSHNEESTSWLSADQHSTAGQPHSHRIDIGIDPVIDPVSNQHVDLPQTAIIIDVIDDDKDDVVSLGVAKSPAEQLRWGSLGPYSGSQRILLVGEGDFSFSASLAAAFGDASNMIATSLDPFEFLMVNYKSALANIFKLTSRMCMVMHGVDATKMANHPQLASLKFDCIVYNFPHAGFSNRHGSRDAQIRKHQKLVRGFLANAKTMIERDGQIHITHKCVGFFRDWNLEMLGSSEGLRLVEEAPFDFQEYPGYHTKFGYGGDANFNCRPSKTYKFQLALPNKKHQRRKQKSWIEAVDSRAGICV